MRAFVTIGLGLWLLACGGDSQALFTEGGAGGALSPGGKAGAATAQGGNVSEPGDGGESATGGTTASAAGSSSTAGSLAGAADVGGATTSAGAGHGGSAAGKGGEGGAGGAGANGGGAAGAGGKAGAGGSGGTTTNETPLIMIAFPEQKTTAYYKEDAFTESRLYLRVIFKGPAPADSHVCTLLDFKIVNGWTGKKTWQPTPSTEACLDEYLALQKDFQITATIDANWSVETTTGTPFQRLDDAGLGNTGFTITSWGIDVAKSMVQEVPGDEIPRSIERSSAMTVTVYGHQP